MKKVLVGILILTMLFCLGGCSRKGTCALCGKRDVEVEEILIKTVTADACADCADDIATLKSLAEWENRMP